MPRRYGQHFLKDPKIVERIVEASGVGPDDAVLEIGPGRGILTRALAAKAGKVLALEIDRALFAALKESALPPNVDVRLADALTFPEREITAALGPSYRIVANLPYDITTAFLQRYLTLPSPPKSITVMIQKEVGDRIVAADGKQSRLSLFCGYFADTKRQFTVSPGAFSPPPKVDSVIITLISGKKGQRLTPRQEQAMFSMIEASFSQKRKSLKNTLRRILGKETENKLNEAGIDPAKRPEEISLNAWMTLAERM